MAETHKNFHKKMDLKRNNLSNNFKQEEFQYDNTDISKEYKRIKSNNLFIFCGKSVKLSRLLKYFSVIVGL